MNFEDFYTKELPMFDAYLYEKMTESTQENPVIQEAMLYSVKAGGKRLRPLITLLVLQMFQKNVEIGYAAAAAVELLHTYSLIHDDLPAMDDDDLRRGQPANHKKFGEATAILAGDALLTKSFEVLACAATEPIKTVALVQLLAQSAGSEGMIAGQQDDIEGETRSLTLSQLPAIHEKKTGALLTYSFLAGAILAEADDHIQHVLANIAQAIGLAYQIRDDILDVIGDVTEIGKPVGSDAERGKSTYPALVGLQGAKDMLADELTRAKEALRSLQIYCQETKQKCDAELLDSFIDTLALEVHT